jgi:hypothetical protein
VKEPVARASARRTVRVAVALVAGQAALCAVIGWVTLGGAHPHNAGPPAPNPLAGGPLVVPPLTVAPAPPTSGAPAPHTSVPRAPLGPPVIVKAGVPATSTSPPKSTAPQWHPPITPTPQPVTKITTVPPAAPTVTASPSSDSSLARSPSPTPTDVQQGVVVGDPCDPVGAAGTTSDGTPVLCVLGDDGVQRWQIM